MVQKKLDKYKQDDPMMGEVDNLKTNNKQKYAVYYVLLCEMNKGRREE